MFLSHWLFISLFQLTPSRRATRFPHTLFHIKQFQLTPSRRATYRSQSIAERRDISTHALTEGDPVAIASVRNISYFNSRPHGGRQTQGGNTEKSFCISTHALTEGDRVFYNTGSVLHDFNSRPHGGRLSFADSISPNRSFQLTPSRRATSSLHMYSASRRFQLTPSRRATSSQLVYQVSISISTHALTEGDGSHSSWISPAQNISTHALTEGDFEALTKPCSVSEISTHALTEGDERGDGNGE